MSMPRLTSALAPPLAFFGPLLLAQPLTDSLGEILWAGVGALMVGTAVTLLLVRQRELERRIEGRASAPRP